MIKKGGPALSGSPRILGPHHRGMLPRMIKPRPAEATSGKTSEEIRVILRCETGRQRGAGPDHGVYRREPGSRGSPDDRVAAGLEHRRIHGKAVA